MKHKTMYERYRDKELPKDVQKDIEFRQSIAETQAEKDFIAGFWTHCRIDEIIFPKSKEETVYISGAITGLPKAKYEKAFEEAERFLEEKGFIPINPLNIARHEDTRNWTWEDFMKRDIPVLLKCKYIYLLPNWKKSKGAKFERLIAQTLNIFCLNGLLGEKEKNQTTGECKGD